MKEVFLSKKYRPIINFNLLRIGSKNDGGYLIPEIALNNDLPLVSLGINDDWQFETDMLKNHRASHIYMFDPISNKKTFLKLFFKNLFHFPRINPALNSLKAIFNWDGFIKNNNVTFYPTFVGIKDEKNSILFKDLIKKLDLNQKKFNLKIDIEGSEYRLIKDLLCFRANINFLVIEFHDFDFMDNVVDEFINNLGFLITHVHVNNYGFINHNGKPNMIEITLINDSFLKNMDLSDSYNHDLPHKLDAPSNPEIKEIKIKFV